MERVEIKKQEQTETGWNFLVEVGNKKDVIEYSVILDKEYWQKITGEQMRPEKLIKKSFEFLLEREPKESILRKFNLREINGYFPEYEDEIVNKN